MRVSLVDRSSTDKNADPDFASTSARSKEETVMSSKMQAVLVEPPLHRNHTNTHTALSANSRTWPPASLVRMLAFILRHSSSGASQQKEAPLGGWGERDYFQHELGSDLKGISVRSAGSARRP